VVKQRIHRTAADFISAACQLYQLH